MTDTSHEKMTFLSFIFLEAWPQSQMYFGFDFKSTLCAMQLSTAVIEGEKIGVCASEKGL